MSACPTCGTELRDGAKFCDECGAAIAAVVAAEYKQVTVLFADVVHSMDIAAAVGPERLREVMSAVFDTCCDVVQRYGGTVDKFTGDGIMAVFGAPIALEDHAFRAALAALEIQRNIHGLADMVQADDGVDLRLRIGLNSGEVIAGGVGSRTSSYTTIGDQVGMAQRMESAAPPSGVMVSAATARLIEGEAVLSAERLVTVKGFADPVPAHELISVTGRRTDFTAPNTSFVGRDWEITALTAMLERAASGRGCVVGIVGPAGIGKSRIVTETAQLATHRGVQVHRTYCESHTTDVAFQATTRLLRSAWGVDGLDDETAREAARRRVPGADPDDLRLLFDELGIRDPSDALPEIAPEARRRRITALVNASVVARTEPVVYVIEDAHWIDPASESLLEEFLAVIPQAHALVLITYRPEYTGVLSRGPGAQTIALAPLDDAPMARLVAEQLGQDASVAALASRIAEHASGNPFFAGEIIRDLADRGVLRGERGAYTCVDDADVEVPATVQAAIAARIDRLPSEAKQTLSAAAVIGLRFDEDLLKTLADTAGIGPLLEAELIDQVSFTPRAEYAFRHPLIRSVAYRSQLSSARADLHRRLAAAIETRDQGAADEHAALIAEHLEAAGDLAAAFHWHMRAAAWWIFRDVYAARSSWQRARDAADRLPADESARDTLRLVPRALLCASTFRVALSVDDSGYEELCALAAAVGDKDSLAIATGGQVAALVFAGRYPEAAALASQCADVVQAIDDPVIEVMQLPLAGMAKILNGEVAEGLRFADRVIDLCQGDRYLGKSIIESPLTIALTLRAAGLMLSNADGWKQAMLQATADAREYTPMGEAVLGTWRYAITIATGAFCADGDAVQDTAEILRLAEQLADDLNVVTARLTHGFVLARHGEATRARGVHMLRESRQAIVDRRTLMNFLLICDVELAIEELRSGDVDGAIDALGSIFDREMASGGMAMLYPRLVEYLVEALLLRGAPADIASAHEVVARVAAIPIEDGFVLYELPLLRSRALLARAENDESRYRHYRAMYRERAIEFGYEGHIATADAMA
jgi:adenylate cyclase